MQPAKPPPSTALTADQIALVRDTWTAVLPQHAVVAELFYARLFELDPTLRALFKRDMAQQGTMLLATLNGVVASLDRLEAVLPSAQRLAVRHVDWGVQPAHYDTVGQALLDTLERGLGAGFTAPVRRAWALAYAALAGAMKAAAYPAPLRHAAPASA
jgi:hemoglobin-like flavoprotein